MRKNILLALYIVFIHLLIIVVVFKPHIFMQIKTKFFPREIEVDRTYSKTHAFYKRINRNLSANKSIFLGDSHIQGLAVSEVIINSVNFGIGKDTIQGLIHRISDYDAISYAQNIIIAVGINDLIHQDIEFTINKYQQLLKLIPTSSFLVVNAIFLIDEELAGKSLNNVAIKRLNLRLQRLVEQRKNSKFININAQISSLGQLSNKYHIGDGIHLNEKGYDIWIKMLNQSLIR